MIHYKSIITALSLVSVASCLNAALLNQTVTFDDANIIASGSSSGNSNQSVEVELEDLEFEFDQFDPTLGTLEDVYVTVWISHSFSVTSSSLVTSDTSDDFQVVANFHYVVDFEFDGIYSYGSGAGNGNGTNTPDETIGATATLSGIFVTNPSVDDILEGTGTVVLQAIVAGGGAGQPFMVNGYFTDYSLQRDAGAFATLTYDYTPVPELSTSAMIVAVIALGVVGSVRRGVRMS